MPLATDDLETTNVRTSRGGAAYLADATLPPALALDVQLEVRQRNEEPPTSTQLQTILSYLKNIPQWQRLRGLWPPTTPVHRQLRQDSI